MPIYTLQLQVVSQLEDSLTVAASALSIVKSVEPNIISIQCLINEDSLDYLLFKKLPGNTYSKKFTKSSDVNRQPNSCLAWKVRSTHDTGHMKHDTGHKTRYT